MKLFIFLLLMSFSVFAQRSQTINADCLRIGVSGDCISATEFNYLDGVTSDIQTQLDAKADDSALSTLESDVAAIDTRLDAAEVDITDHEGRIATLEGEATIEQYANLGAFPGTGVTGTLYLAQDTNFLYRWNGSAYVQVGGGGTVNLASGVSGVLPLANGGTNKNLTATAGRMVYSDADSFELTSAGTSGQILQSNGSSAPTFVNKSILNKNQAEAFSSVTEEIQAPNSQLTETSANKYLIETGNKNILFNPSFEDSTAQEGWTLSGCSAVPETAQVSDGSQALKITCSAQTLSFYQDSTRYAGKVVSNSTRKISAYATAAGAKFCARNAGSFLTSECVDVPVGTTYGDPLILPSVFGATSNGVGLKTDSSFTGDVYVDAGELNLVDTRGTTTLDQPWTAYTPSLVSTTNVNLNTAYYRREGDTLIVRGSTGWNGAGAGASAYTIGLPSGLTINTAKLSSTTGLASKLGGATWFDSGTSYYPLKVEYNSTTVVSFRADTAAGTIPQGTSFASGDFVAYEFSVPITGWSSNSDYYSASCGANCVDTFSAMVSSTGVVSQENIDWLNGDCTNVTSPVCTFKSGIFTVAPNCWSSPTGTGAGGGGAVSGTTSFTSYLYNTSFSPISGQRQIFCQKQGADFTASRTITGSFKEVVTSPGVTKPKKCIINYGASGGSLTAPTVCSSNPCTKYYDSCGSAGTFTWNATGNMVAVWNSGTWANSTPLQCGASAANGTNSFYRDTVSAPISSPTGGTSQQIITGVSNSGTTANSYGSVWCEGQAP